MLRLACFLVISALLGPALQAQPAFLVKDINPGVASPWWPHETEWVALGGLGVFTRPDSVHGIEIWKSDGTAAGTTPILDICPGICSSNPRSLAVVGSVVFFHADDGVHGPSLWKTDGTAAGTTLVREVSPFRTVALGNVLLFQRHSPPEVMELWRSDGTRDGTFLLTRFGQGESLSDWLGYAGGLLFVVEHRIHGHGLWKTDGTAAGTSFIKNMGYASLEPPIAGGLYPSIGGRLFFLSDSNLWVSDGTLAGTYKVSDVPVGGDLDWLTPRLTALGNEVFFSGQDSKGLELWKSDGTPAGTVRVKDIHPGTEGSNPQEIIAFGDHVFFRTWAPSKLWKSDGTEAGTVPVAPSVALEFKDGYNGFQILGDKLVFFASANGIGHEPWVTDGTGAGTMLLADVYPGIGSSFDNGGWYGPDIYPLSQWDGGAIFGGHWIFRAMTPSGWAVWKSDGTPAGTEFMDSVNGGASSVSPFFNPAVPTLADLDRTLIFTASDDGEKSDLWRSDGSAPGTSRIDAPPLADGPRDLTRFGDHVYFGAGSVWRTDGATPEVFDHEWWNYSLTAAGPHLFYVNSWSDILLGTDGTTINQIMSSWDEFEDLTAAGTNLYFVQRRYAVGEEQLWKSGGAPNDAVLLRTFPYAWPHQLGAIGGFGNSVFFAANDGSTGQELWFSDGTAAGTRLVKDIVPGAGSSAPRSIVAAGNLAFFVADDGIAGAELWRTDGTASGTFRVKDIRAGSQSSWIRGITTHGDRVLFAADDGVNGVELWTSDGTGAGTVLVEDIRPGAGSSFPGAFQVIGHAVLFAADDGAHGLELWRTDGTAPGTFLIQDVFTGPEPSSPTGFTLSGDYVYFIATDQTHGFELWALDRAELGPALSAAKTVVSPAFPGGTVTFEIVVTNSGTAAHPDNPGDEMVDLIPAPLALTGASTDLGAVSVNLAQNRVAWNGALDPGESATVTIEAAVPSSTEHQTFFNQAILSFDADGDGASESASVSDDPGRGGSRQATPVVISSPPVDFHTVAPCRVLDTRGSTPLASGVSRTVTVGGTCGIPATAKAVAANLTVLEATAQGNLVVYPTGIPVPATSNANFSAGQVRANNAQLPLAGGQANARAFVTGGGTVHLILDVSGYYE